ncbi:lipase [Chloropicon primus]|nr:lipase [Chloropicon primus]
MGKFGVAVVVGLLALLSWEVRAQALPRVTLGDISKRYDDARTDPTMTDDRDVYRDAFELAASKGYEVEKHKVTTQDGYVLGLVRIVGSPQGAETRPCPGSQEKPPVLLQHGLIDSSATWVMNMPRQSLGFVLADLGYDVWLGNNRGTTYSMEHRDLREGFDAWDEEFWDFSWDEMAAFDLPAEIRYVLDATGSETLSYVSHSQGTTQGFAAFSLPEFADLARRVNVHIALAPVAFVGNTESLLFQAAGHLDVLRVLSANPLIKSFGNTFLGTGVGADFVRSLVPSICGIFLGGCDAEKDRRDAHNALFDGGLPGDLFGLPDMQHLNQSRIPVYLSHLPEGTSVKNLIHWSQAVKSSKFRKYDYGRSGNLARHGSADPPEYDLRGNYRVPTVLVSGSKDPIANRRDVRRLLRILSEHPGVLLGSRELPQYDHNDFTLSTNGEVALFPYLTNKLRGEACSKVVEEEEEEAEERGRRGAAMAIQSSGGLGRGWEDLLVVEASSSSSSSSSGWGDILAARG